MNFSAVHTLFDESGALLDQAFVRRAEQFLKELSWMAKVLRHGCENVTLE